MLVAIFERNEKIVEAEVVRIWGFFFNVVDKKYSNLTSYFSIHCLAGDPRIIPPT